MRVKIIKKEKFMVSTLISTALLLIGVLLMAYGFFTGNRQVTYVGIFITGAAAWAVILITIIGRVRFSWRA